MSFIEPIRRKIEKILHEIGIHNKAYDSDLDGILDDTAIPDLNRSKITDFFTSPFWNNIPDKPNVVISPMTQDLNANQYRIFNLPFPTASYEVATKEYVDLATVGFGLALYLLDAQDSTYTDYKATTIEIPILSEAYVEAQSNVAGDILVGQWVSPNGFVTTLKKGLYELHFQAQRISGNITLRSYFELYERESDGTEILIATSSIADIFDERRDIYVTLVLDQDYILATDSRIVIKVYIRYESQGAETTGRIYYQGDVRSRLSMPTAKEVLDTIYAGRYHATQHELGGADELSLDASQITTGVISTDRIPDLDASKITSGVFDLARIPNIDWSRLSGNFPRAIGDLISSAFSRSWISDFFDTPFWGNIPDKPSVYPPELHASAHGLGGADEIPSNDILLRLQRFNGLYWHCIDWLYPSLTEEVSGSGSIDKLNHVMNLITGETADSWAKVYRLMRGFSGVLSFDKPMWFGVVVRMGQDTAQNIHIAVGIVPPRGSVNTNAHIGFKVIDNTLYGTVADGTTEATLNLGTITANSICTLECVLTPATECRFYVNREDKGAITTNLPTGNTSRVFDASIHNTEAADKTLSLYEVRFLNME